MIALSRRLFPLVLAFGVGCSSLRVEPFSGSWISLTMSWPILQPMPMGPPQPMLLSSDEHLELWAQLDDGHTVRIVADEPREGMPFPGFAVLPALSPNDPCLIRALNPDDPCAAEDHSYCGAHLLSADAQSGETQAERMLAQQALVQHVRRVVPPTTGIIAAGGVRGQAPVPLLVLVQHDPGGAREAPSLMLSADNAGDGPDAVQRLRACRAFAASYPNYYLGNPRQLTKPLHGVLYGFFRFNTTAPDLPPQNFGGIVITTLTPLRGLRALWITRETDAVPTRPSGDPTQCIVGSRCVAVGTRRPEAEAGRGVIRLILSAPSPMMPMGPPRPIGTASVLTGLDEGLP
ncbi:MAG: hypothetical protein RMK29_12745 [Myxococcales bacterium]|nr:hypothetical protein [Myxococcota bacterium]MDW8282573.1 hypothetical protein [Myxococcales bacterium]